MAHNTQCNEYLRVVARCRRIELVGQNEYVPNYTPVIITPQPAFSLFTENGTLIIALYLHRAEQDNKRTHRGVWTKPLKRKTLTLLERNTAAVRRAQSAELYR